MEIIKEKNNIKISRLEIDVANIGHVTNTYIVQDMCTMNAVLIDPAFDAESVFKALEDLNAKLVACILTHSHADHFGALAGILKKFESEDSEQGNEEQKEKEKELKIYIHELDLNGLNDETMNEQEAVGLNLEPLDLDRVIKIKEGECIKVDSMNFEVIHTPGHTVGGIVLYEKTTDTLFSGDTIFKNTYGRTDLKGGSSKDMKDSLDKIFYRFDDIDVFPGHDEMFKLDESKRKIKLIYAFKG